MNICLAVAHDSTCPNTTLWPGGECLREKRQRPATKGRDKDG